MYQYIDIIIGLVFILLFSPVVGMVIPKFIPKPEKPDGLSDEQWKLFSNHKSYGGVIGFFERLLSFAAFTLNQYTIIAGWLAFKLAAKWEVWKNIVQVPEELEDFSPPALYQARQAFGSWLFSRFTTGTLINILVGLASVHLGQEAVRILAAICN